MLIAHEAPRGLMSKVQAVTDYDYCLVHLLEEDPWYLEFFKEAKKMGRKIIMDCSLFELGEAFDSKKYEHWIKTIKPDEFIVPDVWQDYEANLDSFSKFRKQTNNFDGMGKVIGVLQAKTLKQFADAYQFMATHADKVAISFGYDYYIPECVRELCKEYPNEPSFKNVLYPRALSCGRQELIWQLLGFGVIDKRKPHHLLGCGLPTEFSAYKSFSWVESIDTSHPVIAAIHGRAYSFPGTIKFKDKTKMVELYDQEYNEDVTDMVLENIAQFKLLTQ